VVSTVLAREISGASGDRTVLNASGYVTARREATVSSKVTGKVTEVFIEEGVAVKSGQVLAKLDDTNAQASVQLGWPKPSCPGSPVSIAQQKSLSKKLVEQQ
jgi:multidrug efflux pump subunit AcrA (membrane-fusion protein)